MPSPSTCNLAGFTLSCFTKSKTWPWGYLGPSKETKRKKFLGELGYKVVSFEKAKNVLGWGPSTSFTDGINQTIDWYRANI